MITNSDIYILLYIKAFFVIPVTLIIVFFGITTSTLITIFLFAVMYAYYTGVVVHTIWNRKFDV